MQTFVFENDNLCSVELNMKKSFITSGPDFLHFIDIYISISYAQATFATCIVRFQLSTTFGTIFQAQQTVRCPITTRLSLRASELIKCNFVAKRCDYRKIVSEYDQEIPQSQTADKLMATRRRATQPSRDTSKTNQAKQSALSSPSR